MTSPEKIATPAEFATQLKTASRPPQPPSLKFLAPTLSMASEVNHSSASNPQNASFVMGWGSTEQPNPFRGLNGNYAQASVHFTVNPTGKSVGWIALNG